MANIQKQRQILLHIFDLDNVLSLLRVNPARRAEYEGRLRPWLRTRREAGDILAVASFNHQATDVLRSMGVLDLFHHVEADDRAESKVPMLRKILSMYPKVDLARARFYDDDMTHVEAARLLGITSHCIAPMTGLPMVFQNE
jgi:predicted phosphatase